MTVFHFDNHEKWKGTVRIFASMGNFLEAGLFIFFIFYSTIKSIFYFSPYKTWKKEQGFKNKKLMKKEQHKEVKERRKKEKMLKKYDNKN